jgi:hypothetical protein
MADNYADEGEEDGEEEREATHFRGRALRSKTERGLCSGRDGGS